VNAADTLAVVRSELAAMGDDWAGDVGAAFNCGEADRLAAVFALLGLTDTAAALINGHADDDDAGDFHWCIAHEADPARPDDWSGDEPDRESSERAALVAVYVDGLTAGTRARSER